MSQTKGAAAQAVPNGRIFPIAHGAGPARSNGDHEQACPCREISGTALTMRQLPGFRVVETRYTSGLELPLHFHQNAFLTYVVEGPYSESYGGSAGVVCQPGTLRYLPPGQKHSNVFRTGALCLNVEIEPSALQRFAAHTKALERPGEIQSIVSSWLAQRLYHEFRHGDPLALLALEGILLEILAEGARHAGGSGPVRMVPLWLRTARKANWRRTALA